MLNFVIKCDFFPHISDEMSTWFTPWLQHRFPSTAVALAISSRFEFLLDRLHPPWMMIVPAVLSVSVGIT